MVFFLKISNLIYRYKKVKSPTVGNIIIGNYASRKEVRAVVVNNSERDFSAFKEC